MFSPLLRTNQTREQISGCSDPRPPPSLIGSNPKQAVPSRDHKVVDVRLLGTPWREIPSPYDQHHMVDFADTPAILRSIEVVGPGRWSAGQCLYTRFTTVTTVERAGA